MKKIILIIVVLLTAISIGLFLSDKFISSGDNLHLLSSAISSSSVRTSSIVKKCDCICPNGTYGLRIFIGGKGSKKDSEHIKWIQEISGSGEEFVIITLDQGVNNAYKQVENLIKEKQSGCPKVKVLIVGFSLGAALATNLEKALDKGNCIDTFTIDGPSGNSGKTDWCKMKVPSLFNAELKQICKARNSPNYRDVNWTNGNSGSSDHYPWSDPEKYKDVLDDLKKRLKNKVKSCTV